MYQFTPEIRKLIYTTNPIEGFNRQLRKVSKNRGVFPGLDCGLETAVPCYPKSGAKVDPKS